MTTTARTAVGYCRVSTTGQADDGVSLADQENRIRAYATAHGYRLLRVEVDAGLSGGRADNRPALQRALTGVCKTKGVLIVCKLDRLARSTRDAIDLAERIDQCGADLASIGEAIDTASAAGRFVFRLMASLGEMEREVVGERTRAAMAHKRGQGQRISRHLPYGYRLSDDGLHLVEDEDQQRGLRRMRELRAQGLGYLKIANTLTAEGFSPSRAAAWSAPACHKILCRNA
jgi:site-specific DNA recombinase